MRKPGARRDHYVIDQDVWHELFTHRDEMLVQWTETIRDGRRAVGTDSAAGRRLTETVAFFEFLHDELLAINKRWAERRAQLRSEWGVGAR